MQTQQNEWDNQYTSIHGKPGWKVLELLRIYAGAKKAFFPGNGLSKGFSLNFLFSSQETEHETLQNQVRRAIEIYYQVTLEAASLDEDEDNAVYHVLSSVHAAIDMPIDPNDSLVQLLATVKNKTGVDFYQLEKKLPQNSL